MTAEAPEADGTDRVHAARRFCYGFFAGLFLDCRAPGVAQAWPEVARLVDELEAIARDGEPSATPVPGWPADEAAFGIEFARVFYGVGPATVPMAASCYTNDTRLNCQGPFHAAREFYARCGQVPSDGLGLPDDHLAVELAFLHALAADPATLPVQREFVAQHLLPWVPAFCAEARSATTTEPLRGIVDALERLVSADSALLQVLAQPA